MTASLSGFISSIFLGTFIVVVPITVALILVSRFDPLARAEA